MAEEKAPVPTVDEATSKAEHKRKVKAAPIQRQTEQAKPLAVEDPESEIERACQEVVALRKRPLLVLYYPPGRQGRMIEADVPECYDVFRNGGVTPEEPLEACDVLLHTTGGSPVSGYRLAQCIRDFARDVVFLVPEHAYSAGTLLCFSGDAIRLGHYAGLSPIDITMVEQTESGLDEVELASFDSFVQFTDTCQRHIQKVLASLSVPGISRVGASLLCELVNQVGALRVGAYYRARTLTGHYAQELLDSYMLAGKPNGKGKRDKIIRQLLFEKPAHEFHIDYHICTEAGLEVSEMDSNESDASKRVVTTLDRLARREQICLAITDNLRLPFIAFYPFAKQP